MRIAVIDGQGGGIGRTLIEGVKQRFGSRISVLALGTNSHATANMLKAGADEGATGERAIVVNAPKVDVILGVVGIIVADAMLGELTPAMALAVAQSPAQKILIPQNRCGITMAGLRQPKLQAQLEDALALLEAQITGQAPQNAG